jgi:glycolate oxidase iron-sulfur subunit
VYLFDGCVMDRWFGNVQDATRRVLEAAGYDVRTVDRELCCGALHLHAGRRRAFERQASRVVAAYTDGDEPIAVTSAGCGAALKEYSRTVPGAAAAGVAGRVVDAMELVAPEDLPPLRPISERRVGYHAACHLLRVQHVHERPLALLRAVPELAVVEPGDGHLCCGAGGGYSLTQPRLAGELRRRKLEEFDLLEVTTIVSANPGCSLHLASPGRRVAHPMELLAEALPSTAEVRT